MPLKNIFLYIMTIIFLSSIPVTALNMQHYQSLIQKYQNQLPQHFSENAPGVITRLPTDQKVIALTLDACGGEYNKALIDYLMDQQIPATLFIAGPWIEKHAETLKTLAKNPLFEIENHGLLHRPCSVNGQSIYKIKGTENPEEVIEEIEENAQNIAKIIGHKPRFYRSGTAYYDEIAVQIAKELGAQPVNFDIVSGDAVPFNDPQKMAKHILSHAKPGSIVIMHMNHPAWHELALMQEIVPALKAQGYQFVLLTHFLK